VNKLLYLCHPLVLSTPKSNELERSADSRHAAVSSRQYASCLTPVASTSGEEVGTKYSGRNPGQVNDPNGTEKDHRVQGLGVYPKQLHPKVREQNI